MESPFSVCLYHVLHVRCDRVKVQARVVALRMADDKLLSVYEREGRNTSSKDPKMLNSRVFIGNLASDKVGRQDIENLFATFGKVLGVSLHKSYGFVQFESEESAKNSVNSMHGHMLHGLKMGNVSMQLFLVGVC